MSSRQSRPEWEAERPDPDPRAPSDAPVSDTDNARGERSRSDRNHSSDGAADPVTSSLQDLLHKLKTDPHEGLHPKEAERRRNREPARPLFGFTALRMSECIKYTLKEPVLWILLTVSVVALFFNRVALGLSASALALGHLFLSAYLLYHSETNDAALQSYDAPLVHVVRNGRILRLGAELLVRGDIILLYEGDIVPADCRLIASDRVTVSEQEMDGDRRNRRTVHLEKRAEENPSDTRADRLSPPHMLYAGDVMEIGFARAVVTAVGSDTHLGGLMGTVPSAHTVRTPRAFRKAEKYLSRINLVLVCLIIPLTVVGIFTLRDRYDLLDMVLTAIALAALTLTTHVSALGRYFGATVRAAASTDRHIENTADIKTSVGLETICRMTDLVLVGTGALHDGQIHPESLLIGRANYHCQRPESDAVSRTAVEWLYLYGRAAWPFDPNAGESPAVLQAQTDRAIIDGFTAWAELDTDALQLRVTDLYACDGGVRVTEQTGASRLVRLSHDFRDVELCTHMREDGRVQPMDETAHRGWYRAFRQAVRTGFSVCFLITEDEESVVAEALLTYGPHTCPLTGGCIRQMESAGIRVTAFTRTVSDEHTRLFAACGLTESAAADRPVEGEFRARAFDQAENGIRAFEGCDTAYISDYIDDLKAAGRVVGVLSVDKTDLPLLDQADVAYTCAPSLFASSMDSETRLPAGVAEPRDGTADGICASDLMRRAADVIVRRSTAGGGGVCGVRRSLMAAEQSRLALHRAVRFTVISQMLRMLTVLIPLCLGLSLINASALLLSGLGVDWLVALMVMRMPTEPVAAPPRALDDGLNRPLSLFRADWIAVIAASVLPWLSAGVAQLLNFRFGADLSYYSFLCLIGTQFLIFRTDGMPRKNRMVFFTSLVFVCVYAAGLGAALGAGLHWLYCLIWPLIAPVGFLLTRLIARFFLTSKK